MSRFKAAFTTSFLISFFGFTTSIVTLNCLNPAKGVVIRVAESLCEAAIDLIDEKGDVHHICPVVIDLVTILGELRSAEAENRPAIIRVVDGRGDEQKIVVPVNRLGTAIGQAHQAAGRIVATSSTITPRASASASASAPPAASSATPKVKP